MTEAVPSLSCKHARSVLQAKSSQILELSRLPLAVLTLLDVKSWRATSTVVDKLANKAQG